MTGVHRVVVSDQSPLNWVCSLSSPYSHPLDPFPPLPSPRPPLLSPPPLPLSFLVYIPPPYFRLPGSHLAIIVNQRRKSGTTTNPQSIHFASCFVSPPPPIPFFCSSRVGKTSDYTSARIIQLWSLSLSFSLCLPLCVCVCVCVCVLKTSPKSDNQCWIKSNRNHTDMWCTSFGLAWPSGAQTFMQFDRDFQTASTNCWISCKLWNKLWRLKESVFICQRASQDSFAMMKSPTWGALHWIGLHNNNYQVLFVCLFYLPAAHGIALLCSCSTDICV